MSGSAHDHDHDHDHPHGHHQHDHTITMATIMLMFGAVGSATAVRALETVSPRRLRRSEALDMVVEYYETKNGPHIGARLVA